MRPGWVALAIVTLAVIGFVEAAESARQLDLLPGRGRPPLTPGGTTLSLVGFALSCGVFLGLGAAIARASSPERIAIASGALAGVGAGLIGGAVRAVTVSGYLGSVVGEFGLPAAFLIAVLIGFVVLSTIATALGGGVITWAGFRFARRAPPGAP